MKAPEALRFAVVAVDIAVFTIIDGDLCVLVQPTDSVHYEGKEALIGGIITEKETTNEAVVRILANKARITTDYIEQLATFSEVDRDKRNRVVSVAHIAFVREAARFSLPEKTHFVPVRQLKKLAYDHTEILQAAHKRLASKLMYTTIVQFLLPRHFTLTDLQVVYETVLGQTLDKRNFRKKFLSLEVIAETGLKQEGVKNRPAALYQFSSSRLVELPLII